MFGLSGLATKLIGAGCGLVLLVGMIWYIHHTGYKSGVQATDAKWEAASKKLEDKALKAATEANNSADARAITYIENVAQEKEKLDEAERNGSSALDVLFGNSVR